MAVVYLLDTNIISELRKRKPHGAVLAWFESLQPEQIRIPAITLAELQSGAELTRRQDPGKAAELDRWIDQIMATFAVVPMDGECFRLWSRLMLTASDHLSADAMIAATARLHGLIVATRNVKDFSGFDVPLLNPFSSSTE